MSTANDEPHDARGPSDWIRRWSHLVPAGATVLDVACGSGRHVRWFGERGGRVTAVDRDEAAVAPLRGIAEVIVADIENAEWPLAGRRFDVVVVTNYLWRPLLPTVVDSVAENGLLLYQTFTAGHETVGRPANPDFVLHPAELLTVAAGLRIVAFEEGFLSAPERFVQRLAAVRESGPAAPPARYPLQPPTALAAQVKSADSEEPA